MATEKPNFHSEECKNVEGCEDWVIILDNIYHTPLLRLLDKLTSKTEGDSVSNLECLESPAAIPILIVASMRAGLGLRNTSVAAEGGTHTTPDNLAIEGGGVREPISTSKKALIGVMQQYQ